MRKVLTIISVILLIVLFFSCGGTNYREIMKPVEALFYQGKYLDAARKLLGRVNKKDRNQLLFMMECGYMLHAGGDWDKSNKVFLKAGNIARVKPISISKQAAAFITNQRRTNYRGEDFEKVLLHLFAGQNFLFKSKYDSAAVEFKKVNNQLKKITSEGKPAYKQNIMAKYMTAIAYETLGDNEEGKSAKKDAWEYSYIELKQIEKLINRRELGRIRNMVYFDLRRLAKKLGYNDDLRKWTFKNRKPFSLEDGEFVFIYEAGKTAIKKSRGKLLRTMGVNVRGSIQAALRGGVTMGMVMAALRYAENPIPRFERRSNKAKYVRILIDGREYRTKMLQNIENTAIRNLEDKFNRLQTKVISSLVFKIVAAKVAEVAARETAKRAGAGIAAGLIGSVVGAGTAAALISSVKPDLRCWSTLPANLQLARIPLKPGNYTAQIQYISIDGEELSARSVPFKIEKSGKKKRFFYQVRTLQ